MEVLQPKLRFPEFKENWKKNKLGKVSTNKSGKYNPLKESQSIKCIELEHLASDSGQLLGYIDGSNSGSIKNKFEKGDVLFGKLRPYLKKYLYAPFEGVCTSEIWVLKGTKISNPFLYGIVQTEKFIDIANQSSGSKMPRADWEVVSNFEIKYPSLEEQTRIADFLSAIDEKINLLKEKKILLEEYKKGIMQKIFNQEVRFKDDYGNDFEEWEEKKLGDYKELIHGDGNWILSKDLSLKGKYKLIQLGNVGFGKYVEKKLKTISEDKFKEIKGTLLQKGDLLINRMVDNNLYCCILDKDGDYITSVDVCWIRENNLFNNYFLMSVLLFNENQVKLLNLSSGSGRVRISKSNLFNEFKFLMPDLKEQTKIANFLSAIDEKIELVNLQIEETQEYKKGLLQQMFV